MKVWIWIKTFLDRLPYIKDKVRQNELSQIEIMKWKKIATSDELTGLPNRFCFNMYWEELKDEATVCMVDIDLFKHINDTYGHLTGNEVLKRVAKILDKHNYCFVSRYGGEEFLITCTCHIKYKKIQSNMERLRKEIQKEMLDYKLTVSIGISSPGSDLFKMINQADRALYYAKKHGRNKVIVYSKEMK